MGIALLGPPSPSRREGLYHALFSDGSVSLCCIDILDSGFRGNGGISCFIFFQQPRAPAPSSATSLFWRARESLSFFFRTSPVGADAIHRCRFVAARVTVFVLCTRWPWPVAAVVPLHHSICSIGTLCLGNDARVLGGRYPTLWRPAHQVVQFGDAFGMRSMRLRR